jgi:hypothetical protein
MRTAVDMKAVADAMLAHSAELVRLTRGLSIDGVIATEVIQLDAQGTAEVSSSVPVASIAVTNLGTTRLTVAGQPRGGDAPDIGTGVLKVAAGQFVCAPLASTVHSFYGRAGELVQVTRFAKAQCPSAGQVSDQPWFTVTIVGLVVGTGVTQYTTPWGDPAVYGGITLQETTGPAGTPNVTELTVVDVANGKVLDEISLAGRQSIHLELVKGKLCAGASIAITLIKGSVLGSLFVR